jgi:Mn-dependent DtxR family transcriptional regulator
VPPKPPSPILVARFCHLLREESLRRSARPWWMSVHDVSRRLGVGHEEVANAALHCIEQGLVKASHEGDWHSVSLHEKGRQLGRKVAGLAASR